MKNELWCKVGFSWICPKITSFKLHKMAALLLFRNTSNTFIFFLAMSFKISWIFITFLLSLHLSSFETLFRIKQSQTYPKLKKTVNKLPCTPYPASPIINLSITLLHRYPHQLPPTSDYFEMNTKHHFIQKYFSMYVIKKNHNTINTFLKWK